MKKVGIIEYYNEFEHAELTNPAEVIALADLINMWLSECRRWI